MSTPFPHRRPRCGPPSRRRPRWLHVVGLLGVVAMAFTVWLGLWVTPPDEVQGNLARLLYIHPAIATVALYWAGIVAAGGSLLYLWPRTRSLFWDRLAGVRRRGRCGVLRADPHHRLIVGPPGVGRVVDLGRPTDLDRAAAPARDRVPGPAARAGRPAREQYGLFPVTWFSSCCSSER